MRTPTRRGFLAMAAASAAGAAEPPKSEAFVPLRTVTRGPRHHWFGYYDKHEFDPAGRYLLSNQVEFEHRSPGAGDAIRVGMVDLHDGDRWTELGTSRAWGWQQGCMLQWLPAAAGSPSEVLWNDREGERFVARIMNPQTRATRTLPHPIYTVAPDGTWGLSLDFARLNVFRPGYGYAGVACRNLAAKAPDDTGIWRVDLKTGAATLLVSLARLAALPHRGQPTSGYWNWVNHLLVDPSGRRFVFLHRWREQYDTAARTGTNFVTRMFSADTADGGNLFMLDPSGHTSHFIWRDPERLCMWTRPLGRAKDGFFLFRDRTAEVHPVGEGKMPTNGHNTYVPGTNQEWILNDTYPAGRERLQSVYLFHVPSGRRVDLGRFHSPAAYAGEWRCDTHPRCSRDGKLAALDSPHGGAGRQVHLLDLSKLVG